MAEEFSKYLERARGEPIEKKVNDFGQIVEKMMQLVLRIPEIVDESLANMNSKMNEIEQKVSNMNNKIENVKKQAISAGSGSSPGGGPSSGGGPSGSSPPAGGPPGSKPPSGGPPGNPPPSGGPPGNPPPSGGPPGSPPPSPGGGGGGGGNPVSVRGAIMGELKQLFAKKKQGGGD
jgi:hypothetical protein